VFSPLELSVYCPSCDISIVVGIVDQKVS